RLSFVHRILCAKFRQLSQARELWRARTVRAQRPEVSFQAWPRQSEAPLSPLLSRFAISQLLVAVRAERARTRPAHFAPRQGFLRQAKNSARPTSVFPPVSQDFRQQRFAAHAIPVRPRPRSRDFLPVSGPSLPCRQLRVGPCSSLRRRPESDSARLPGLIRFAPRPTRLRPQPPVPANSRRPDFAASPDRRTNPRIPDSMQANKFSSRT